MSIADKLTQIAENEQKVYDAGYAAGQAAGGGGYDEGYADGKQAEYDRFWDTYGGNGSYAYAGRAWTDEVFKPNKDIVVSSAANMFIDSGIQKLKQILQDQDVVLDVSNSTSNYNFARSSRITHFPFIDFRNCSDLNNAWNGCTQMVELSLAIKEKAKCSAPFTNCPMLTDLTIVSGTFGTSVSFAQSPLLSDASIQSIIDHLADLTGGTAQTLTFHTDVLLRLTDEQIATILAKNWTLVFA